jgi:hypothetical protein
VKEFKDREGWFDLHPEFGEGMLASMLACVRGVTGLRSVSQVSAPISPTTSPANPTPDPSSMARLPESLEGVYFFSKNLVRTTAFEEVIVSEIKWENGKW